MKTARNYMRATFYGVASLPLSRRPGKDQDRFIVNVEKSLQSNGHEKELFVVLMLHDFFFETRQKIFHFH
jgi:hypothetical protein